MATLGIDLGTATLATAATRHGQPPTTLTLDGRDTIPTILTTSDNGLHPTRSGEHPDITNPLDALNHRVTTTESGHVYTFPTILTALLTPLIEQVPHTVGGSIATAIGVCPGWWPNNWRDQYRRALQHHAGTADVIGEDVALAVMDTHTPPEDTVAIWDFGKSHASVTVLTEADRRGVRIIADHAFTPDGGASSTDLYLAAALGWPDIPEADTAARRLRHRIATATHNAVDIELPAELGGPTTMTAREGIDLVAAHIEEVVTTFRGRVAVDTAAHHIAIGGFAQDRGVQSALRQYGHLTVADNPATALASAAATHGGSHS